MQHKITKWRKISSKVIFSGARISVCEDIVELPDGTRTRYYRYLPGQPRSVTILALSKEGKLLLQQEYNYPPDEILWQLPGGNVEEGEDSKTAALRELSEESGYSARSIVEIGSYYTNHRRSDQKQYVFLCKDLFERKLAKDPDEFIESHWLTFAEIERMKEAGELKNMNLLAALYLFKSSKYFKEAV